MPVSALEYFRSLRGHPTPMRVAQVKTIHKEHNYVTFALARGILLSGRPLDIDDDTRRIITKYLFINRLVVTSQVRMSNKARETIGCKAWV